MNEKKMKELVGAICPDLKLSGCYVQIMPRITADQLGKLLDVAEQGDNAPVWGHLAIQFLQYGNEAVIAAHIDRLLTMVPGSFGAAVVLVKVPSLPNEYRDRLIPLAKEGYNADWVLRYAPNLTPANRDMLVSLITDRHNAASSLVRAPNLSDDHRNLLVKRVTDRHNAIWVLAEAPNLSDEQRKHLETMAEQ